MKRWKVADQGVTRLTTRLQRVLPTAPGQHTPTCISRPASRPATRSSPLPLAASAIARNRSLLVNEDHALGAARKRAVRRQQAHCTCRRVASRVRSSHGMAGSHISLPETNCPARRARCICSPQTSPPASSQSASATNPSPGPAPQMATRSPGPTSPSSHECQAVGRMSDSST